MRQIEDADKRRQFRVAHGLEEPAESDKQKEKEGGVDDQSPIAADVQGQGQGQSGNGEYVDFEGKKRPVKKWFGIW